MGQLARHCTGTLNSNLLAALQVRTTRAWRALTTAAIRCACATGVAMLLLALLHNSRCLTNTKEAALFSRSHSGTHVCTSGLLLSICWICSAPTHTHTHTHTRPPTNCHIRLATKAFSEL